MRKASYTVEAAFLLPILLGIVFLLMYVMFLWHDQAVLQGNFSYVLCREAEEEGKEKRDWQKRLEKGLWFSQIKTIKIDKMQGRVSGEVSGTMELKIPVMSVFIEEIQQIVCTGEYYYLQPEQNLWIKKGDDANGTD